MPNLELICRTHFTLAVCTKEARKINYLKVKYYKTIDRCTEIERSNKILLKKLANILKTKDSLVIPICRKRNFTDSLRRQEAIKLIRKSRIFQLHPNSNQIDITHRNRTLFKLIIRQY